MMNAELSDTCEALSRCRREVVQSLAMLRQLQASSHPQDQGALGDGAIESVELALSSLVAAEARLWNLEGRPDTTAEGEGVDGMKSSRSSRPSIESLYYVDAKEARRGVWEPFLVFGIVLSIIAIAVALGCCAVVIAWPR